MTSHAFVRRVYVKFVNMTAHTHDSDVTTGQLVAHHSFVIEAHLGPSGLGVTINASFAEITEMLIVFCVTGVAITLHVVKSKIGGVTVLANDFQMVAQERKVCQIMVEGVLIQVHDIRVPPFVIRVAFGALAAGHFRREAVEPRIPSANPLRSLGGNPGIVEPVTLVKNSRDRMRIRLH